MKTIVTAGKGNWRFSCSVAQVVLEDPDRYPFRIVSRAAGVVADMDGTGRYSFA